MDGSEIKTFEAELGAETSASDWGKFGLNVASETITKGVDTYQASEAKKKQEAEDKASAQKAIAADAAAVKACADVELARKVSPADVAAKESVAAIMTAASDSAGAGLSPAAQKLRLEAANKAAASAAEAWAAASQSDKARVLAVCSANLVKKISAGSSPLVVSQVEKEGKHKKSSFFTQKWGPLPVYGWGIAAAVTAAVVGGVVHVVRRRKK